VSAGPEVRPLSREDLALVCEALPARAAWLHEERLAQQEGGHGPYLVAWFDGRPVGHVQLQLPHERDLDAMLESRGAAWAEDLWVAPEARGRWAGPTLMRHLEAEARRARIDRVVFFAGVAEGYAAARAIYRWMGWRERPGRFVESALIPDEDGRDRPVVEIVTMWEKEVR
jgi:GNAT superfamily N-acetyltransferase